MSTAVEQLNLFTQTEQELAAGHLPGSNINLRPYQQECLQAITDLQAEGENRLIAQLATGLGKTIIFSALAHRQNTTTLILAHRDELLTQAISKLRSVWPGADIGRVQAEKNEVGRQITVSSVQTLSREKRFSQAFPDPSKVGLVISDECHHSRSNTYRQIYGWLNLMTRGLPLAPLHVGVTATPIRGDKKTLGEVFDRFAFKMGILEGVKAGYLSDMTGYALQFNNEAMADVHIKNGDYDEQELEQAVLNVARCEAIVECWQERAKLEEGYRRTVVFCVSIQHAKMVAETFSKYGVRADVIYSGLPYEKRQKVLADFEDGKLDVICNCMILTEGWDCPATSCVVVARPTRDKSLYIQMAGRGVRLHPGKANCLIIDVADVSSKMSVHFRPQSLERALELKPEDGKDSKEVQSVMRMMIEKGLASEKDLKFKDTKGGGEFNPFADPFDGAAKLRWTMGGTGLTLPLPQRVTNTKHFLVIKRRKDYLFDVVHVKRDKTVNAGGYEQWKTTGEKFVNQYGLPDQTAAANFAEKYALEVCPEAGYKARKNDFYREEPATAKQLEFLAKGGVNTTVNGRQVYKSEASALLDALFTKKIKAGLNRRADELEIY